MKGDEKCKNEVVWGIRGHPRSTETYHLISTYDFLFDFNRNYAVIASFWSKVTNFNPSNLHLSPP